TANLHGRNVLLSSYTSLTKYFHVLQDKRHYFFTYLLTFGYAPTQNLSRASSC
ncbi:9227_t:CDS:1, partial [Funneliformis caledonium]